MIDGGKRPSVAITFSTTHTVHLKRKSPTFAPGVEDEVYIVWVREPTFLLIALLVCMYGLYKQVVSSYNGIGGCAYLKSDNVR